MTTKSKRSLTFLVVYILTFSLILGSIPCFVYADKSDNYQEDKNTRPAYKEGELLIKFKDGTRISERSSFNALNGLNKKKSFDLVDAGLYTIKNGKSMQSTIRELLKNDTIEYVQPNYLYYPASLPGDPYFNALWGLNNRYYPDADINAPDAWDITQGSEDVVVAVIDTGIDFSHPELSERMWRNPGEIEGNGIDDDNNGLVDDICGWNFYKDNNTVFDGYDDHGTHIAGIIAAQANTEGIIGVAPKVKIMSLKFIGPEGGTTADAIAAINYARSKGVRISNNSWGGSPEGEPDDRLLKEAIEASGMLFVASAGNDGKNIDIYPDVPCSFNSSNIIAVAAVHKNGRLASFSNYGAASVDVAAPGVSIFSTIPQVAEGNAAVEVSDAYKVFVATFGLENLESQEKANEFLNKAMSGMPLDTPILLVDDDGNEEQYYTDVHTSYSSALAASGYTVVEAVYVASDTSNGPALSKLNEKEVVIWFTGETFGGSDNKGDFITALTAEDQANLKSFLDNGKTLMVFGQDALFKITDSVLVKDYFDIKVVAEDYGRNSRIEGVVSTVFDAVYSDMTGYLDYIDHISPILGKAKPMLKYAAQSGVFYGSKNGTSMAAPYVTGVAALLLSKNPDLTAAQLKSAIIDTGTSLQGLNGVILSGKIVNAFNALKKVAPAKPTGLAGSVAGTGNNLSWQCVESGDFRYYRIERRMDIDPYAVIGTSASKSYLDITADTSIDYSYRVGAVDNYSNVSAYSNEIVIKGTGINSGGSTGSSSGAGSVVSGGGGGGGSGANISSEPSAPNPSIDSRIQDLLTDTSGAGNVRATMTSIGDAESAAMNAKSVESLGKSGKSLTLAGSNSEIVIPGLALMTEEIAKYLSSSGGKLNISIKELKSEDVLKQTGDTPSGLFMVGGRVFEYTAVVKTNSDTFNINKFGQELKLSIKLMGKDVSGVDVNKLGVYCYNNDKKVWEYVGGVYNPQNNTITFDTNHFSIYAVMKMENGFSDIGDHWAKQEIELMAAKHIIEAGSRGEYGPNEGITRAEVVKMLVNMLRFNPDKNIALETPQTATFNDVKADNPYFAYVETAVKHGIIKVSTDKAFNPDVTITREQLATMIMRALDMDTGSDISVLTYDDKDKIPEWAASSIAAAYERGFIQSINGKDFGVGQTATRAQATVIIKRVMEKSGLIQVPLKLKGKLMVNEIEGKHYELETKEGIYVLIYDMDNKFLARSLGKAVGKDVEVSGYIQYGMSIYQRGKMFKTLSVDITQ